jgi:hypothetical protein
MRTRILLLLALLAPAAAHSQTHTTAPAPARALDPVGSFDLEFDMHGQVTGAVLTITREKDQSLKGTLEVHGQSITLETVSVEGRVVSLAAGSELTLTLTFSNDHALLGKWTRSDDSGSLSGTRRKT